MIKKKIWLFAGLCVCTALCLAGCKGSSSVKKKEARTNNASETTAQTTAGNTDSKKKILIAYFTRADNVKQDGNLDAVSSASVNKRDGKIIGNLTIMAQEIQRIAGGDLFSIKTSDLYSQDYDETVDQAQKEQNENVRPRLSGHVKNMDEYDVVFLGYPNWWGELPMAVETFLEEYQWKGKTIIPFCSHGGSALGSGPDDIQNLANGATVKNGLAVEASDVSDANGQIKKWIQSLNI